VEVEDEGVFRCTASNSADGPVASADIRVVVHCEFSLSFLFCHSSGVTRQFAARVRRDRDAESVEEVGRGSGCPLHSQLGSLGERRIYLFKIEIMQELGPTLTNDKSNSKTTENERKACKL